MHVSAKPTTKIPLDANSRISFFSCVCPPLQEASNTFLNNEHGFAYKGDLF